MFEYVMENYGFQSEAEIDDEILYELWEEHGANMRREWLEKRHIAQQKRLREIHYAEQAALFEEWNT